MYKSINKMTKKEKKKYYSEQRGNWGDIKPITQIKQSKKLYNRKKNRKIIERSVNKDGIIQKIGGSFMIKKKKIASLILASCILGTSLAGCQTATRSFGGDMIIELDPGEKLELITWKEDSLWYLTRPMREDEKAETHIYEQSSEFGVFEGSVTIKETNKEDK